MASGNSCIIFMGEVNLLKLARQKPIHESKGFSAVTESKPTTMLQLHQMPQSFRSEEVELSTISYRTIEESSSSQLPLQLTYHFYALIFTITALLFFCTVVGICHASSSIQKRYRSKSPKKNSKDTQRRPILAEFNKGRLSANDMTDNFLNALFTDQTL